MIRLDMNADANGTSYVDCISTSYIKLAKLFGEAIECDGYKVSGQWLFSDENGNVFTIYDWKATSLYDEDYPTVEEFRGSGLITQFNIGGHGDANEFLKYLNKMGV